MSRQSSADVFGAHGRFMSIMFQSNVVVVFPSYYPWPNRMQLLLYIYIIHIYIFIYVYYKM